MNIVSKIGDEVVSEFVYLLSYTKNKHIVIAGVGDFLVFSSDKAEEINEQVTSAALNGLNEFVFTFAEEQRPNFSNPKKFRDVLKEIGNA